MAVPSEDLLRVPFFSALSHHQRAAAADLANRVRLPGGVSLWAQGQAANALAIVVEGHFDIVVDGVKVARVGPGEIIGEIAAFFKRTGRSADVVAASACSLIVLSKPALRKLRADEAEVDDIRALRQTWRLDVYDEQYDSRVREVERRGTYSLLLHEALLSVLRRVRRTNGQIAKAAQKTDRALPVREESFVKSLLRRVMHSPTQECPPIEPLLKAMPRLNSAPDNMIATLAKSFTARPFAKGEVLFLEGEPATSAVLIASGEVEVLRSTATGGAEVLASLPPGVLVGLNALIESTPRTATVAASKPTWGWEIGADSIREARWTPAMGILFREALLATLTGQLQSANAALLAAKATEDPAKRRASIAEASGLLAGRENTAELQFDLG